MRILMITGALPYPPISGNPLRNYQLLRRISNEHEVWVAALVDEEPGPEILAHLGELCRGVVTGRVNGSGALSNPGMLLRYLAAGIPPELRLYHSAGLVEKIRKLVQELPFDVVDIEDAFMGLYIDALPEALRRKSVLTFHDVVFQKMLRISALEPHLARRLRLQAFSAGMRRWEPAYAGRFARCIAVSEADRRLLLAANPHLQIEVAPNGVDTQSYQPLPVVAGSNELLFVGNMDYRPNIDAVTWFVREILPLIRGEIPQVALNIVGINPSEEVQRLEGDGVHVTGAVADLLPYYRQSSVCVVPLRAGGGTRLKILEAMALRRAVVSTTLGCEGLDVRDGEHLSIADDPRQFAEKTLCLLREPGLQQRFSAAARQRVVDCYDWDDVARRVVATYQEAAR